MDRNVVQSLLLILILPRLFLSPLFLFSPGFVVFAVVDDDFTHSGHSLMRDVPGIHSHAQIVIVWLMPQNITSKLQSRADSHKVVRNDPVTVFALAEGNTIF